MLLIDKNISGAKVSRKDQIEVIATGLFKEKGFAATSMRDLASAVGIEAASIYAHIRSKNELLQSICFKMANEFFTALSIIENQDLLFSEKLRLVIQAHVIIITRQVAASTVFQNEWRHLSQPYLSQFMELRTQYESRIQQLIREGIDIGEFMHGDAKFITRTLLSSLNWIAQWYKPEGELTPDAVADNIANLFLHGLTTQKADRPKYH